MKTLLMLSSLLFAFAGSVSADSGGLHQTDTVPHRLQAIVEAADEFPLPGYALMEFQPGDAAIEYYSGVANLESETLVSPDTLFPVASLTKTWAAIVVLQLAEESKLSLDQSIHELIPGSTLEAEVTIRHLLSHSSHGQPGTQFHYDGARYSLLTRIIEKVEGQSFTDSFNRRIVEPLGLQDTFLLGDQAETTPRLDDIAAPYRYDGEYSECSIEFGSSASAGLVSSARDLTAFAVALTDGQLLNEASMELMTTPVAEHAPAGLGVFVDRRFGELIVWGYGQYDCYSALSILLPNQNAGMVFLANNNTPSDASRLIYGNILNSPIAIAYLRTVSRSMETTLSIPPDAEQRAALIQQAFFSRYDVNLLESAMSSATEWFESHPEQRNSPDLSVVHALNFIKLVGQHLQGRTIQAFDDVIISKSKAVLDIDPGNPYAHTYLAATYAGQKQLEEARFHYRQIVELPNMSRSWFTVEAETALAELEEGAEEEGDSQN